MSPAALRLARLLASRRGDVGEIARALLEAEGIDLGAVLPANDATPRSKAADRMARLRAERRANTPPNTSEQTANIDANKGELFANSSRVSLSLSSSNSSSILETSERENSLSGTAREGEQAANVRGEQANANSEREHPAELASETRVRTVPPVTSGVPGVKVSDGRVTSRNVTGVTTPPPDDIPLTEAIRARCAAAGARAPTAEDVAACLANARKKGHLRADWGAEIESWMIRDKSFQRAKPPPPVQPTGPGGKRLWKVGDGGTA